jgi:hypothetical protein
VWFLETFFFFFFLSSCTPSECFNSLQLSEPVSSFIKEVPLDDAFNHN